MLLSLMSMHLWWFRQVMTSLCVLGTAGLTAPILFRLGVFFCFFAYFLGESFIVWLRSQIIDSFQDSVMSVCLTKTEIIGGSVDGTVRTFDIRIGRYVLFFSLLMKKQAAQIH